ncbi:MAG: DUF1292 domain-containing protein [Clostridium sp.]|nr:DUF1292 domain-containing protein [Clostridium sp.]
MKDNILKFKDQEGNTIELELVAELYVNKNKYVVLAPLDENAEDEYIYRVDLDKDGNKEWNIIEEDKEFLEVKKEYKKLLY